MRAALVAAALVLAAGSASAQQDEIGLPLGAVPPAAQVQDLDGQAFDLGLLVGRRPMIVEFWASWCPQCEALLPRMLAAHRRWGDRVEFVVVGVGVNQTRGTMRRHLERMSMPFRHYFDATGAAVRAFQAPTTSYVVALDARGRVVYTGVGDDQDIELAARRAAGGRQ